MVASSALLAVGLVLACIVSAQEPSGQGNATLPVRAPRHSRLHTATINHLQVTSHHFSYCVAPHMQHSAAALTPLNATAPDDSVDCGDIHTYPQAIRCDLTHNCNSGDPTRQGTSNINIKCREYCAFA